MDLYTANVICYHQPVGCFPVWATSSTLAMTEPEKDGDSIYVMDYVMVFENDALYNMLVTIYCDMCINYESCDLHIGILWLISPRFFRQKNLRSSFAKNTWTSRTRRPWRM